MFSSLSPKQREIALEKTGKSIVRACPGSGKTYSLAARLAHKLHHWDRRCQGVATISFTNVAWKEIESKLHEEFGVRTPVEYPHYLGTIDSFINKYIFLPYGHLIMGCTKRPVLVGEPHGIWSGEREEKGYYDKYFDTISIYIDGNIYYTKDSQYYKFKRKNKQGSEIPGVTQKLKAMKKKYWKQGYASQADPNYFAMRILEKFPAVSKSIVHRFPELMIDEAQDTSDVQMKIIDYLLDSGLEQIMLIGDPDQAIYEWNEARPELFFNKLDEWKDSCVELNENRRSSQNICNFTYRLSSLKSASVAVNEAVKDCELLPTIVTYDINNMQQTIDKFILLCRQHQIETTPKKVAVLYRSKGVYHQINGHDTSTKQEDPWLPDQMFVRGLAKGKYLYDHGKYKEGFKMIERAVFKGLSGRHYCSESDIEDSKMAEGFVRYRERILGIIHMLPKTNGTIRKWLNLAEQNFKMNGIGIKLNIDPASEDLSFIQLFQTADLKPEILKYNLGTVHTVKGETFDAVLLFLKENSGDKTYYRTFFDKNTSQQFLDYSAKSIREAMEKLMVDGIKYEKVAGAEYEMLLFEQEEINSYINRMITVNRSIYEAIEYDSEVERQFAQEMDTRTDVKMFLKLPRWFQIDTPLGKYNPDWAIVLEPEGEEAKLYFVAETKSTHDENKRRNSENAKIRCGEAHFKTFPDVTFKTVTSALEI